VVATSVKSDIYELTSAAPSAGPSRAPAVSDLPSTYLVPVMQLL
jgi:hypothetical protein